MFIYFVEQVWNNEGTFVYCNFETDELSRNFWSLYQENKRSGYPTKFMEEDVDYVNY